MRAALLMAVLLAALPLWSKASQVAIEDTGSTNRPGLRVLVDSRGHATVQTRGAEPRPVKLDARKCKQFLEAVKAAGKLGELPKRHCMKSVSFGSSLFVEMADDRSPDLNCPAQDQRVLDLQKQAGELLLAARQATGVPLRRAY